MTAQPASFGGRCSPVARCAPPPLEIYTVAFTSLTASPGQHAARDLEGHVLPFGLSRGRVYSTEPSHPPRCRGL